MTFENGDGHSKLDRRRFLSMAAGTTLGIAGLGGLAAACGGGDDGGSTTGGTTSSAAGDTSAADTAAATSSASGGSKGRIAFGQPNTMADVAKPLLEGAKQEAESRGYELLQSSANGQLEKQIQEINTWIADGVDAMTILPLDPNAMAPLVEKAHAADIYFISYAAKIEGADGYTIFDDRQGGALVGEAAAAWINDTLGGEAQVALLAPTFIETLKLRIAGAEEALARLAPNAKVVARTEALLAADALTDTRSILQANPDVNVILCAADDGCLGAAQAFEATGRDPETMFIAGWDGAKAVMEKILEGGTIRATGALDLIELGKSAIFTAANVIEGQEPTETVNKYILVTANDPAVAERLIATYG